MNPDFEELAKWIDKTYNVRTVNIIHDFIDRGGRPRLNICFEFEKEKYVFNGSGNFGMDETKQDDIANEFRRIVKKGNPKSRTGIFSFLKKVTGKYDDTNIWIIFSAFEPIAKIEANESIPESKVKNLKKELNNNDIWEISRAFSGVTFFVHTDEQLAKYVNKQEYQVWKNSYFNILKDYDEFGYFKEDSFNIEIDSKENFDNNFESNWYYYYK